MRNASILSLQKLSQGDTFNLLQFYADSWENYKQGAQYLNILYRYIIFHMYFSIYFVFIVISIGNLTLSNYLHLQLIHVILSTYNYIMVCI